MPERDYSNSPDDFLQDYPGGQYYPGGVTAPTLNPTQPPPTQPQAAPYDPYTDYNGGSPVDAPLQADHGWEWAGGRWNQVQGRGLGHVRPTDTGTAAPAPSSGAGSVPSVQAAPQPQVSVPSSTLPSGITDLFNKQPQKTPVQTAYQDALLKYMQRGQQTPSLDDPILGPQAEVYRVQQQRNQERNRRQNVERAAATGQNQSGFVNRKIEKGNQEQNFNTAMFNANLLGGEMDKRRKELQSALQLASATGDNEAARELQARLAQVSAAMQQQGLNLQGQLGQGDLALRLMQTLMGNDQFYDSLGVNTALNMEGLNQRALQIFPW